MGALAEFSQSFNKVRMWWYNILRDDEGRILYCLWFDNITAGYFLLNSNISFTKRKHPEPLLTVKIIE